MSTNTVKTPTGSDWFEWRICWNNQIEEFERLWACWVAEKRVSETHWSVADDIYPHFMRMLHATIVPNLVEPGIWALHQQVDRFRDELARDPSRRGRRFTPFPQTPPDYRLSERFPFYRDQEPRKPASGATTPDKRSDPTEDKNP
jgi:hypothetical protein